jgi:WD40 repeat protein
VGAAEPARLEAHASGCARVHQAARDLHVHYRDGTTDSRRVADGPVVDECPYPGLSPFDQRAARWFRGRDRLVSQLVARLDDRLRTGGPLLVVGPSGAGKSSLLQAGLLPAMARGELPGSRDWPCVLCTPTADPVAMLTERLTALEEPGDRRLLIVVDQLEELFVQCRNPAQRHEFLDRLADLAAPRPDGGPPIALVVYGLRADFYPMCADHPALRAAVEDGQLLVGALSPTELRETILFPARDVGLEVEPGLVDLLLADVANGADDYPAGRLPLLAHALRATWRCRHGSVLTVDGYRTTGGIRNAIATTADAVFGELSETHRQVARLVFLRLVRIGEGTDDVSKRLTRAELLDQHGDPDVVAAVIDAFTAGRLLTAEQDTVRITHDALLCAWPRLRTWINVDKETNLRRQRLTEDAAVWVRNGRDAAMLYRGSRLEAIRATPPTELSSTTADFLATSARQERAAARRRGAVLVVLAVLAFFSSSVAAVAVHEYRAKIAADTNHAYDHLTLAASLLAGADPSTAARLDLLAHRMRPADQAISQALIATENTSLHTSPPDSSTTTFDDDGRMFGPGPHFPLPTSTARTDRRLWDTPPPARALAHTVTNLNARDPIARLLASVVDGGLSVRLWHEVDPARPVPAGLFSEPPGTNLINIEFSANGYRLAAYDLHSNRIQLWDVTHPAHPRRLASIPAARDRLFVSALSADGSLLAMGDNGQTATIWQVPDSGAPTSVAVRPPMSDPDSTTEVTPIGFSPDNQFLAMQLETDTVDGQTNDSIQLWNVGDPRAPDPTGTPIPGVTAAFSPNSPSLAVQNDTGEVQIWNIGPNANRLAGQPIHSPTPLRQYTNSHLGFGPDGRTLISRDGNGHLLLWHLPGTTLMLDHRTAGLAFSGDGSLLVNDGDYVSNAMLWNVADPLRTKLTGQLPGTAAGLTSTAISTHNSILYWSDSNNVLQFSSLSRPTVPIHMRRPIRGTPAGVSASGGILAVSSAGNVTFWNVSDPAEPMQVWSSVTGRAVAFSAGSDHMAVADSPGLTQMYDIGGRIDPRPAGVVPGTVRGLSSDGRTLAVESADNDQKIDFWNTTSPSDPSHLVSMSASSVAFGPDHLLATGSQNGTTRLWTTADPAHLAATGQVLSGDSSVVDALVFSPNGRLLVSGSDNGQIYIWDLRVEDAVRRICADTAPLTAAQRQLYAPGVSVANGCP